MHSAIADSDGVKMKLLEGDLWYYMKIITNTLAAVLNRSNLLI